MSDAVNAYLEVLNGGKWPLKFFADYNTKRKAKEILRHIFSEENIQSASDTRRVLTDEYIKEHHLEPLVKGIDRVPELLPSDHSDLYWLVYPEKKPPQDELIKALADDVIAKRRGGFPKRYFYGAEARHKAILCFQYLCEHALQYDDEKLKKIFSSSEGVAVLQEYKYRVILQCVFPSTTQLLYAAYPNIGKSEGK